MEWTTLSVMGVLLIGGTGALLWQRYRARWSTLTRHTVCCPVHDCPATIVVRTNPLGSPRRQYVDVATCSLYPAFLVTLPERTGCVPETWYEYDKLYASVPGRYPRYVQDVPCHKNCLACLNQAADACTLQPVHCPATARHGPDLAQHATQNPAMTQALRFYSASSP